MFAWTTILHYLYAVGLSLVEPVRVAGFAFKDGLFARVEGTCGRRQIRIAAAYIMIGGLQHACQALTPNRMPRVILVESSFSIPSRLFLVIFYFFFPFFFHAIFSIFEFTLFLSSTSGRLHPNAGEWGCRVPDMENESDDVQLPHWSLCSPKGCMHPSSSASNVQPLLIFPTSVFHLS